MPEIATLVRRTLFTSELLEIGHVVARPRSAACGALECQPCNVVVLPLHGVFAKHDGPRRQVIASPNHAVLVSAGQPYRVSFPGAIGDRCLTLRLSGEALARSLPHAGRRDGFDLAALASHGLLPAHAILARGLLWRRCARGELDPLEIEELGISLLAAALQAADRGAGPRSWQDGRALQRQIERVKEAIALRPDHRWSLAELAAVAGISPFHLSHRFRAAVGETVYRYVLRARLAHALEAILDADTDLTAIALDSGFASHSHFTARFRGVFGVTPSELRRRASHRAARATPGP